MSNTNTNAKIQSLFEEGNQFFLNQNYQAALPKYKAALELLDDTDNPPSDLVELLNAQISACTPGKSAKTELSPEKQNWFKKKFGGFKDSIGKSVMGATLKGLLPTITKMIDKNKPKAIAFMRGEVGLDFQPLPQGAKAEKRIVIIELLPHPTNPELDDLIIQIKRSGYTRIQTATNDTGEDLSHLAVHSGMAFIHQMLTSNLADAIDEVDFDALK